MTRERGKEMKRKSIQESASLVIRCLNTHRAEEVVKKKPNELSDIR